MPRTEQYGVPSYREHSSMLSTADEMESLGPEKEERPQLLFQIQIQLPTSITYRPNWVPPELD